MSPYAVLRIKPDASPEEIEEAYYRMRRLITSHSGVKEREIQKAYALLTDPLRKSVVDQLLVAKSRSGSRAVTATASGSWLKRLLKK